MRIISPGFKGIELRQGTCDECKVVIEVGLDECFEDDYGPISVASTWYPCPTCKATKIYVERAKV